jgi:hypothetical protein
MCNADLWVACFRGAAQWTTTKPQSSCRTPWSGERSGCSCMHCVRPGDIGRVRIGLNQEEP